MTPDERLLVLAGALEANAKNPKGMRFDLDTWLEGPGTPWYTPWGSLPEPARNCGTVGCAVGLAMLIPALQADGLNQLHSNPRRRGRWPEFGFDKEWAAVEKFFGLNEEESKKLFRSDRYPVNSPTKGAAAEVMVAERIRSVVANRVQPASAVL